MGKKVKEAKKERHLYIKVDQRERQGPDYRRKYDGQYSGFNHTVIDVVEWGPLYFAEEGKGWMHHRVDSGQWKYGSYPRYGKEKAENIVRMLSEEDIPEGTQYLYLVIVRYGDGGTFGRTDGKFDFPGVFLTSKEAFDYTNKYSKNFEEAHDGYFDSYEGWSVEQVELKEEVWVSKTY